MRELVEKINADKHFRSEAYLHMKRQLDEETAKPLHKRDFDKIEQLTAAMSELLDDTDTDCSEGVSKLYSRIEKEKIRNKKPVRAMRKFIPIVCCAAVILAANCISVAALNKNIVSAVIEFAKGGFSVTFNKNDVVELPTSENDPYGLIAECAKYGIYPETPHYIPDGFELEHTSSNANENVSDMVRFIFKNGNQSISFDFEVYKNDVGQIGIPSDHYNISETEINGYPAIVSKEDNQYTITYQKDKTVFFMFADGVPYDECEKIVKSIK